MGVLGLSLVLNALNAECVFLGKIIAASKQFRVYIVYIQYPLQCLTLGVAPPVDAQWTVVCGLI